MTPRGAVNAMPRSAAGSAWVGARGCIGRADLHLGLDLSPLGGNVGAVGLGRQRRVQLSNRLLGGRALLFEVLHDLVDNLGLHDRDRDRNQLALGLETGLGR